MELAAREDAPLDGFAMFGVIKETAVDDVGLTEFHDTYFPFPLYRDEGKEFFRRFGGGKFYDNLSWNPFKVWSDVSAMNKRLEGKKVEGNLKGDGLITGGLLVFDAQGEVQYMYKEVTGIPIDEEVFLAAVRAVREADPTSTPSGEL